MKLNKKTQYALLFVLYLCRSGRATIDSAALNLKVPKSFLEQIARTLRIAGVVTSVRGFHGGHELKGDPSVLDVLNALDQPQLLTDKEVRSYAAGDAEHRALASYVKNLSVSLNSQLNRKLRNIGNELVANELKALERATNGSTIQ